MSELWRKWHISLSTWVNDYLFTPIVKAKGSWGRNGVLFGLMATFILLGLWHGASWTFICFGIFHGLTVSIEYFSQKRRKKLAKKIGKKRFQTAGWIITFCLWLVGCVFFRSNEISHSYLILKSIFSELLIFSDFISLITKIGIGVIAIKMVILLVFVFVDPFIDRIIKQEIKLKTHSSFFLFSSMLASILIFGYFGEVNFIYFQF